MRRTKEWWARLTKEERSQLYSLETARTWPHAPQCRLCGGRCLVGALCGTCYLRIAALITKGNGVKDTNWSEISMNLAEAEYEDISPP